MSAKILYTVKNVSCFSLSCASSFRILVAHFAQGCSLDPVTNPASAWGLSFFLQKVLRSLFRDLVIVFFLVFMKPNPNVQNTAAVLGVQFQDPVCGRILCPRVSHPQSSYLISEGFWLAGAQNKLAYAWLQALRKCSESCDLFGQLLSSVRHYKTGTVLKLIGNLFLWAGWARGFDVPSASLPFFWLYALAVNWLLETDFILIPNVIVSLIGFKKFNLTKLQCCWCILR